MLVSKDYIEALLPQRPPMVMVDELLYSNATTTRCGFMVDPANIFTEAGHFGEAGMIENIAQTAAAGVGYLAQQNKTDVPVGYIGAIKNLEILLLPKAGDWLETEVTVVNKVFDITMINATIHCNGALAANCEMKIFITKQS